MLSPPETQLPRAPQVAPPSPSGRSRGQGPSTAGPTPRLRSLLDSASTREARGEISRRRTQWSAYRSSGTSSCALRRQRHRGAAPALWPSGRVLALEELSFFSREVKILGVYPANP